MTRDDVREAVDRVNVRLAEINRVLDGAAAPTLDYVELSKGMREVFDSLNLDRQRTRVDTLMTVYLLRAPRGGRDFDPDSVVMTWKF